MLCCEARFLGESNARTTFDRERGRRENGIQRSHMACMDSAAESGLPQNGTFNSHCRERFDPHDRRVSRSRQGRAAMRAPDRTEAALKRGVDQLQNRLEYILRERPRALKYAQERYVKFQGAHCSCYVLAARRRAVSSTAGNGTGFRVDRTSL
jgi:hypothetical protein